jgi:murein DD-endopeptidase MepM/ murein hydrolase activator NlpD
MRVAGALLALVALTGCIPPGADDYYPADRPPPPARDDRPWRDQPPPDYERQQLDEGVTAPPSARPAWEARPVTPDAQTVEDGEYVVRPGDTLRGIGNRTGAGSEAIARANNLAPPFTIQPGLRLAIPGGRYHEVKAGETGIAIARAYGVQWSNIVTANALEEPYILRLGQRVLIPGERAVPRTPAERAAAFTLDIDDLITGAEPTPTDTQRPVRPVAGANRVLAPTAVVAPPARFTGAFAWPLRGELVTRFGRGATGIRNDGIKIAVPLDTPIKAAADGTVAYAGTGVAGLGGLVMVKHGDGWTSVYGHAGRLLVQRGQAVKKGQTIAYSGDSGFADRPELHFELRKGRVAVDPLSQLPR